MRKVSSAPNLNAMDRHTSLPHPASKLAPSAAPFAGAKPMPALSAPLHRASGGSAASRGEALKTRALLLDISPPPPPLPANDAELLYAVASEGVMAASACMPAIEMDEAPQLAGFDGAQALARARDAASCMATPVMPADRTNGELVSRRAARLGAEAAGTLRARYAAEVGYVAAPRRLRRADSRKRGADDLEALLDGDGGAGGPAGGASSPETKRLLAARVGLLEDGSNKLHLDDNPEPVRPTDCSFSLEEADHGYLVGGSTSSLASMDSAPSAPAGNVVAFRKAVAAAARVHAN